MNPQTCTKFGDNRSSHLVDFPDFCMLWPPKTHKNAPWGIEGLIEHGLICNMDNGKVTAPTLLDMSAAFDTIDHSTLLERLHGHFGISGWYSFFNGSNHTFQTDSNLDGSLSCPQDLHVGVPQGSVLGPFLLCLYSTSISQIIRPTTHDVSHHNMHAHFVMDEIK